MQGEFPDVSPLHELQVWCASTRRWTGGFFLDGVERDGRVRLRRSTDLHVLPASFPSDWVRRLPAPDGPWGAQAVPRPSHPGPAAPPPMRRNPPEAPIDRTEPAEPMESTDPLEPMLSTDPAEPIERNEPTDSTLQADHAEPSDRVLHADQRDRWDRQEPPAEVPSRAVVAIS